MEMFEESDLKNF